MPTAYPDSSHPNRLYLVMYTTDADVDPWGYGISNRFPIGQVLYSAGLWEPGYQNQVKAASGQLAMQRVPTSDDSYAGDWTGSDGTRYQSADEPLSWPATQSPSSYLIHGTTIGNICFGIDAVNVPAGRAIYAVNFYYLCRDSTVGTNHFHPRVKIGSNYYDDTGGYSVNPGTVWGWQKARLVANPATGVAWTAADVNNLTGFGLISHDATPTFYLAGCVMEIVYYDPATDPGDGSSWIELEWRDGNAWPNGYPAIGDIVADNDFVLVYGCFVPYIEAEREPYIYPSPDGKVWYAGVTGGYQIEVGDLIDNVTFTNGLRSVVTEVNTAEGWFKMEEYPGYYGEVLPVGGMELEGVRGGNWYFFTVQPWTYIPPPTSFEDSRAELEGRGYIAIYIDKLTEALKIFEIINEAISSYLYSGYDGKYKYRVFALTSAEGLLQFTDEDIFSYKEIIDAEEISSYFRTEYAYRTEQDYPQVYLYENEEFQFLQNSPIPVNRERRLPFTQREDAVYWTQRASLMWGQRLLLTRVTVTPKGWPLEPGDFITLIYTRGGINAVFEVIEVQRDLDTGRVELTLGNQHGLAGGPGGGDPGGGTTNPGIWMDEAPTFPASLGGGSMEFWDDQWSAEQKAYARQNAGFWTEESGFADATDPESGNPSTWV